MLKYNLYTCEFLKFSSFKAFLFSVLCVFCFGVTNANAQSARSLINDGVELYKKKQFTDSEVNFKKGMEKVPDNFNAYFNLGDAQYKQERYDEAVKAYQQSLAKTNDNTLKSRAYHNIGNSLLKAQKIKESVDAYKNALRLNPKDEDTKYNLSYALNLLKQEQDKNQDKKEQDKNQDKKDKNKQNKDQNKKDQDKQDKNKDQNKDQNNKDQDKKNQDKQDNKDQNDKNQQNNNNQQPQPEQQDKEKMSKQEAERILNAIKNNEQDLQKKLRKHEGKPVKTDKDW